MQPLGAPGGDRWRVVGRGGGLLLGAVGAHEEELADHFFGDAYVAVAELAGGREGQVAGCEWEGGWGVDWGQDAWWIWV